MCSKNFIACIGFSLYECWINDELSLVGNLNEFATMLLISNV